MDASASVILFMFLMVVILIYAVYYSKGATTAEGSTCTIVLWIDCSLVLVNAHEFTVDHENRPSGPTVPLGRFGLGSPL